MDLKVASETGGPITAGAYSLAAELAVSEARVKDYAAIVVPCMGSGDFPVAPGISKLVSEAYKRERSSPRNIRPRSSRRPV